MEAYNNLSLENSSKQEPAENARKELIDKNWRWYFWLFFPLTYLLSVEKSRQKKVLLSYLLHPALLQSLAFLFVWAFGDFKNFSKDFIWLFLVVFAFYGICSLLIIPATRKFTEAYNISLKKMVFLTFMYLCSFGFIFQFSTTIAFVVSLIAWVVYMADKSLNVDKAIKVCFNIWYGLQILWFVLGGLYLGMLFGFLILLSNADLS